MIERYLIRNPENPQSPKLPLYKEILRFLPKLRKNGKIAKRKLAFLVVTKCYDPKLLSAGASKNFFKFKVFGKMLCQFRQIDYLCT